MRADNGGVSRHGRWLWLLAGLFAVRVAAQPLALVVESPLLPRFDTWHGGVLPYPVLLASQLAILAWLAARARQATNGAVRPSRKLGRLLFGASLVYGATMTLRLALGVTLLDDHRWFASPLPTVFHIVLAAWLFVYARVHLGRA